MTGQEMLDFKNWAVCGDVLNPSKVAHRIVASLEAKDYQVFSVNPRENSEKVYKSLKEIGERIDVLDLCINPIRGLEILKEARELGIDKVLIQPGAESEAIIKYCEDEDISYLEGCVLVELSKKYPRDI